MSTSPPTDRFIQALDSATTVLLDIPEYHDMAASDRLSAMYFILLDQLDAISVLVADFNQEASYWGSPFHKELRSRLGIVLEGPDVPGVNRLLGDAPIPRFLAAEFLVALIGTSLGDDSEDRQRSTALADRLLTLASTTLTSLIPTKVVEVGRYAVEAGYLPIDQLPIISTWFQEDE
jgi:hypothetical protein